MKKSYVEGLAARNGPESCGGIREDDGEALTGVRAGWVLSREIIFSECRRCERKRKATSCLPVSRGSRGLRAVRDPKHVPKHLAREPGGLLFTLTHDGTTGRIGKSKDASR